MEAEKDRKVEELELKDDSECGFERIYRQKWSQTLHDIVFNFLRTGGYLPGSADSNQLESTPKAVLDLIGKFHADDRTNYKTFHDYITAIVLYKYLSTIAKMDKQTASKDSEIIRLRKEYKLTVRDSTLSAKKVFKILRDYKASQFTLEESVIDDYRFNVIFVDHRFKENIMTLSYPSKFKYHLSDDEVAILRAMKNYNEDPAEMKQIQDKAWFKTGTKIKEIRYHTITRFDPNYSYLHAVDYPGNFIYFIFQFRFFAVIIHDVVIGKSNMEKLHGGKTAANQYRLLMEQFTQSGLGSMRLMDLE